MSLVVVDASVAVKWYLPEMGNRSLSEALALLDKYEREEVRFAVPDLFYAETASAIWKAVRVGRVPLAFGDHALILLTQRKFPTVPHSKVIGQRISNRGRSWANCV